MSIYTNGSETSNAAAESLVGAPVQRLERLVFDCVKGWGDDGLTTDQIEQFTALPHQTASPRVHALAKRGLLKPTGQKRPTRSGRKAMVYVAV